MTEDSAERQTTPVEVISISEVAVGPLLFGSGFAALVYQTTWLREFRLIFGVSTAASAAVLAIFMGGLGFGGYVLGKRADRHGNPLRLYGNLEVLVSVLAGVSPFLTELIRVIYIGIGGASTLGPTGANLVRLALTAIVLGLPTFFMGGTLPAAVRAVEVRTDKNRTSMAWLYGMNTLGAVTGVFLTTFLLLELYGNRATLWLAALINLLVAIVARSMSRKENPSVAGEEPSRQEETSTPPARRRYVLVAAFVCGLAFFLMEIVWYRMLGPLLGGSTFTFGLILGVALLGIGLGGLLYSLSERRKRVSLAGFGLTAAIEALFLLLPLALGDRIAFIALLIQPLSALGFGGSILQWSLIASVVAFVPAVIAGYQFPLLVALMGEGRKDVGRDVGLTYLANTAGAITGALAGGFGLLPLLGAVHTWRSTGILLIGLSLASLLIEQPRRLPRRAALYVALAAIALTFATGPTAAWRHSGIGAGRAGVFQENRIGLIDWANAFRRSIIFETDGIESSIAASNSNGVSLLINGKSDGNSYGDAGTQIMGGLLGVYLHPEPRDVLVIGLGTGSSAGWAAAVDEVESVDVIELEPAVVEVAAACTPVNMSVLANDKVDLQFGDAREFILTSRKQYDVIFSEPSNPYRAGVAGLFTREFYESVEKRLAEGGVFLQWVQGYEITPGSVGSVYATLQEVFPHVQTWASMPPDLLLVASREPLGLEAGRLRSRLRQMPFSEGFQYAWGVSDLEGVFAHLVASQPLTTELGGDEQPLNTDDRTVIEFGMARMVGRRTAVPPYSLVPIAEQSDKLRPPGFELDWFEVERRRLSAQSFHGVSPLAELGSREMLAPVHEAFVRGDALDVLAAWPAGVEPADLTELLILGWAHAQTGSPEAPRLIGNLKRTRPVEAEMLRGVLADVTGDPQSAARYLHNGLLAVRSYPWIPELVLRRSIELAERIGRYSEDPEVVASILEALREPYSTWIQNSTRVRARLNVAANPILPRCSGAMMSTLEELEPYPPWDGSVLARRAECYEKLDHPLRQSAIADLERFARSSSP